MSHERRLPSGDKTPREILLDYEDRLGIKLTASKNIPTQEFEKFRSLGKIFLSWLLTNGYISQEESAQHEAAVLNPIVLTHEEHVQFLIKALDQRIAEMERRVLHMPREMREYAVAQYISVFKQQRHQMQAGIIPIANQSHILSVDNKSVESITTFTVATKESEGIIPAAVAEEVIHLFSKFELISKTTSASPEQLRNIEEVGVKYYVLKALAGAGFMDEMNNFQLWSKSVKEFANIWRQFISRTDTETAKKMFFEGTASELAWQTLVSCIQQSIKAGKIK